MEYFSFSELFLQRVYSKTLHILKVTCKNRPILSLQGLSMNLCIKYFLRSVQNYGVRRQEKANLDKIF